MTDCPFCKIANGDLPASIVHQDDRVTAFLDVQPINAGHILIIPNEHVQNLENLPPEIGQHLFSLAQQIALAIRKSGIQSPGINFFLADGKQAMQEVPHLHLHVFPRFEGDGFEFQFSPTYFELPTRDELDKNAHHIKQSLQNIREENQGQ